MYFWIRSKIFLKVLLIFLCLILNILSIQIIIIGAGSSGLSAANEATKLGFKQVTILEGRNRIGGRVYSDNTLGYPVDLGAAWIHGIKNNPIYNIANTYKISTYMFDYDNKKLFSNFINGTDLETASSSIAQISKTFKTYLETKREQGSDTSLNNVLNDFIQQKQFDDKNKALIQNWAYVELEDEYGTSLEDLSRDYYDSMSSNKGEDVLIPSGYSEIFKQLSKNMDIRLEKIVTNITQNSSTNKITVTTKTGENFEADYVIVTIPLGCLKKNTVQFSPELSEAKKNAIKSLGFGTLDKIVIEFTEKFWDDTNIINILNNPVNAFSYIINFYKIANKNTLVFLIAGVEKYYSLYKYSNEKIGNDVVSFLNTIYLGKNIKVKNILVTRWASDEFSYGAYSSFAPGSNKDTIKEFSNPEGRIYFAGEHTNFNNLQTVHGAYNSGIDAARKINSRENINNSTNEISTNSGNNGDIYRLSIGLLFSFFIFNF